MAAIKRYKKEGNIKKVDQSMKLAEKTKTKTTCLRMKSGIKVNLNIITQGDGNKSLVLEKDNHKLIFQQNEMAEFITLFSDFLKSI